MDPTKISGCSVIHTLMSWNLIMHPAVFTRPKFYHEIFMSLGWVLTLWTMGTYYMTSLMSASQCIDISMKNLIYWLQERYLRWKDERKKTQTKNLNLKKKVEIYSKVDFQKSEEMGNLHWCQTFRKLKWLCGTSTVELSNATWKGVLGRKN